MTFKEFIKALHEAHGVENMSPSALNGLEVQFNWLDGDTTSILSLYVADGKLHIDIGDDNGAL